MNNVWLPVRCCCTPIKVFGFLKIPAALVDREHVDILNKFTGEKITIKLATFHDAGEEERAVYSEERPASFWRNCAGYEELPDRSDSKRVYAAMQRIRFPTEDKEPPFRAEPPGQTLKAVAKILGDTVVP